MYKSTKEKRNKRSHLVSETIRTMSAEQTTFVIGGWVTSTAICRSGAGGECKPTGSAVNC